MRLTSQSGVSAQTTFDGLKRVVQIALTDIGNILNNGIIPEDNFKNPTATTTTTTSSASTAGQATAWVNFNALPANGTYAQTDTLLTVTIATHGLAVGMICGFDFTSGTGVDGAYTVASVIDANTFTCATTNSISTSGNLTRQYYIRAQLNVASLTDNGVGDFTVNFATPFATANYAYTGMTTEQAGAAGPNLVAAKDLATILAASIRIVARQAATPLDFQSISLAIFGGS